ncbi:DUF4920 domain-containing protein [Aquimarina sp. TRL1]|uniref:DUF4920 domain-containing protein n=1 Tax=Aquimarina sp. (strain TRL1) TaxID=2736252 RepID=UPI00158BCEA6|nr:DUF4920 domain-containing protein [Aquimarina sp. TRL1]QKX05884.1 DUF4920 domain-containing protein [Aquimarina sp. TRL1]
MRKFIVLVFGVVTLYACKNTNTKGKNLIENLPLEQYQAYGQKIEKGTVFSPDELAAQYHEMKEGDTIAMMYKSTVNSVCKVKGCWMRVAIDDKEENMVKFKDYGFFVPMDIENKEVIVKGKAFVTEVSVEEQRHLASDAGKSEDEIAKITTPKKTYSFVADGVLIKS